MVTLDSSLSDRSSPAADPELSVVMVAGPHRERGQRVLAALAAQAVEAAFEVIVVDTAAETSTPFDLPAGISVQLVDVPPSAQWGTARHVGLTAARAPIVAFLEDHCVPSPGWAEAVLAAFDNDVAAVGYSFVNGSRDTYIYRSILAAEYGMWLDLTDSEATTQLPANNIAYRRDVLLAELGERLEAALEVDFTIHEVLLQRGHTLWIAADAVVAHQSSSRLGHLLRGHFSFSRQLAVRRIRTQDWGRLHRVSHGVVTPVAVPLLRFLRMWRALRERPRVRRELLGCLPLLSLLLVWAALGESAGCLLGAGSSSVSLATMELRWPREAAQ
jgi:hypothetical protein